jgi:hypothetical protein
MEWVGDFSRADSTTWRWWTRDQRSWNHLVAFLGAVRDLQDSTNPVGSATEPIDDTSTGKLMEGVLAAFAQFDNDARSDRTRAGMQEAFRRGR